MSLASSKYVHKTNMKNAKALPISVKEPLNLGMLHLLVFASPVNVISDQIEETLCSVDGGSQAFQSLC